MAWVPTLNVLRVSAIFVESTAQKRCCYDLSKTLDLPPTTMFCTLRSMQKAGWLAFEMEEINSSLQSPGQRRVLYRITETGLIAAIQALTAVQIERRSA